MTEWAIKLPMRSKYDTLGDLVGNARHLDEDDAAVVLELVAVGAEVGFDRVEQIAGALEVMTPSERLWSLNRLRKRAGLESHRRC